MYTFRCVFPGVVMTVVMCVRWHRAIMEVLWMNFLECFPCHIIARPCFLSRHFIIHYYEFALAPDMPHVNWYTLLCTCIHLPWVKRHILGKREREVRAREKIPTFLCMHKYTYCKMKGESSSDRALSDFHSHLTPVNCQFSYKFTLVKLTFKFFQWQECISQSDR